MNSKNRTIESIHVHFLPSLVSTEDLANDLVIMIDLLRASTTISHALENGAKTIIPCETVEEAITQKSQYKDGSVLLGGERGGEMIPGFDLDNSPFSYGKEKVQDKSILFTTTNGTKALKHASLARRILVGSFVNLKTICNEIMKEQGRIHFLCAGTNGKISSEDILCAGAMVHQLASLQPEISVSILDDQSQISRGFFESIDENQIENAVRNSQGGRNLIKLGLDHDIQRASELNRFQTVPEYIPASNCIQFT